MEEEVIGIEETKDVLIAMNKVALLLATRLKDGLNVDDAFAFFNAFMMDGDVKEAVMEAWDGYDKIPSELSDLDLSEGLELGKMQLDFIPEILVALKK